MRRRLILAAIAVAACGASPEAVPDDLIGRISIVEYDGISAWASVLARFDEPAPLADQLVDDGTCRVFRQPCLGNVGACGAPPSIPVGTIRVDGLRRAVELVPGYQGGYYADLPADAFADDATIAASADEAVPFALTVAGVEPMRSALAGASLPPFGDAPVAFEWTPGSDGARVRLTLNVASLCHAGADWLVLECDVDDLGALTVSDEVMAVLPTDYEGCGGLLARYRGDRVVDGGRTVELHVGNGDFFDLFQIR